MSKAPYQSAKSWPEDLIFLGFIFYTKLKKLCTALVNELGSFGFHKSHFLFLQHRTSLFSFRLSCEKERGSSKIEKTRINRAINGNGKLDNSEGP